MTHTKIITTYTPGAPISCTPNRQADRFYDGDIFIDPNEDDQIAHSLRPASTAAGIDNIAGSIAIPSQAMRSRDNMYEYRDKSSGKKMPAGGDPLSMTRAPSSVGGLTALTQTTRSGSQSSLRSAISLKESVSLAQPTSPTSDKSMKFSERSVDMNPRGRYEDTRSTAASTVTAKSLRPDVGDETHRPQKQRNGATTPVPTARKQQSASRTHLIEGIPQTEV